MHSSGNRTTSLSATCLRTRMISAAFARGLATAVRIEAQVKRTKPNRFMESSLADAPPMPAWPGEHHAHTTGMNGKEPRDRRIDRPSSSRVEQDTSRFNGTAPRPRTRCHGLPPMSTSPSNRGDRGFSTHQNPGIFMTRHIQKLAAFLLVASTAPERRGAESAVRSTRRPRPDGRSPRPTPHARPSASVWLTSSTSRPS